MIVVAALYKFVSIDNCVALKEALLALMKHHDVNGTLIIAQEGINGTIAGSRAAIDALKALLIADGRFVGMEYKESFTQNQPFKRKKIHIKKEIVTLGRPDINPNVIAGDYVDASTWNALLADERVTILDVRNDFEVQMGTFDRAINPHTKTFRDFVAYVENNLSPDKHKIIAMSCTGGIRCEKASSLMKSMGFATVYHLKGGVLKYLEDTPKSESRFRGECFVFDDRISVDHDLKAKIS